MNNIQNQAGYHRVIIRGLWSLYGAKDFAREFCRFYGFLDIYEEILKEGSSAQDGGDGSGNFGHAGRPGKVGGSAPANGNASGNGGETESGSAGGVIHITGKELGEYSDIKELRAKAVSYYKDNLQGDSVEHPKLGEVAFTRKGMKKFQNTSVNEDKLKLLPAVPDIIRFGEYQGKEDLTKDRKDGIICFHRINAEVKTDVENDEKKSIKKFYVSVLIFEDEYGNKFYNINPNAEDYKKVEVL